MKKQNKGFTIVELVIVIAVIAVLAAVLIPTFSSLIKKANLSADRAAVRDMNSELAADQALHGKPANIEEAMKVLGSVGLNTNNWKTLTAGYAVYWYKEANRMILYKSATAEVEYPEEFAVTWKEGSRTVNIFTATNIGNSEFKKYGSTITLEEYNHNVNEALEMDIQMSSNNSTGGKTIDELVNGSNQGGDTQLTNSEKAKLQEVGTVLNNANIKAALNLSSNSQVYVNATNLLKSTTDENALTYASMNVMSVGSTAIDYKSSGAEVVNNLYYISVTEDVNATASQVQSAQQAASKYVYSLFTQINEKKIDNGAAIVLASGTKLDASTSEWKPVKRFEGYFGTADASNPVIVSGARLTDATSYSATVTFDGSAGKYFVTGFFGTLYGTSTVENVRFENMTINNPANDFDMANSAKTVSRNSVSIFGGVIDGEIDDNGKVKPEPANVTLRNIEVADTVTINGAATAAGLVAYVGGSADGNAVFNGTLLITGCKIHAKITGNLNIPGNDSYGPCGGIIGFSCRAAEETSNSKKTQYNSDGDAANNEIYNIVVENCVFDGTLDGYKDLGGCIGNMITGQLILKGTNNFAGATYNAKGYSTSANAIGGVAGLVENAAYLVFDGGKSAANVGNMAYYAKGTRGNKITDDNFEQKAPADSVAKYDTVKSSTTANLGLNNGTK